jgi:Electron transfer DM13
MRTQEQRERSRVSGIVSFVGRQWKVTVPAIAALLALFTWLAFGYFGVHTLFFDDEVNEAPPVFASGAGASGLISDETTAEVAEAINKAMADEGVTVEDTVDESVPEMQAEVVALAEGMFIDRSHPTSGHAIVLSDGTEQRFLRFEDFATDNGPDLNVYLSAAPADAPAGDFDDDFIDLGDLEGNIGPQNYEIASNVDLGRYSTVVIWCVRFGVAFGSAELG